MLLVVRPHADDLDGLEVVEDLVDEAVLDVDSAGAGAGQVADESLVPRRGLVGILAQNVEEPLSLRLEARAGELLRVPPRLAGVDEPPAHQSSSSEHFSTGVLSPLRIDSLIPGTEVR